MFESLAEIENLVKTDEFRFVKRKMLLFDATLKMANSRNDLDKIKGDMDSFFGKLENDKKLYLVFAFNRYILYKDIENRMSRYET